MPGLLVSVRSAEEARLAAGAGASVIDVKEPSRGPLGRADESVWRAVRAAVPASIPVSVALGELRDSIDLPPPPIEAFSSISFRKLGLAGSGARWREDWAKLRDGWGGSTAWIAVIYADFEAAGAPDPDTVILAARESPCAGVLIDTWDKTRASPISVDREWTDRLLAIRDFGGLVALAGGLDVEDIVRLLPLEPDIFAVRGSACSGGDRVGRIDPARVERLVDACVGRLEYADP